MNKLLLLFVIQLLISCDSESKTYKVEFNSGKTYRVKSTGYYHSNSGFIHFYNESGIFPKDSVKAITVENYE